MRDAFPIVAKFGERLQKQRDWATCKALIVLVAQAGPVRWPEVAWAPAAALADALGVSPDAQESIYREVYKQAPPPGERTRQPPT